MVKVLNGICEMPDICGNKHCPYFDTSKKATERYIDALLEIESMFPSERNQKYTILEFSCPFLAWKQVQAEGGRTRKHAKQDGK